jgi:hypothetical protein
MSTELNSQVTTQEVAAISENTKQGIVKRAIIYALLFDMAASLALGFLSTIIYTFVITGGAFVYFSDLQKEIAESSILTILFFVWGTLISIMSGYLCAQIAKDRPYTHALWAGSLLALIHFGLAFNRLTLILTKTTEVNFLDIFNILLLPTAPVIYLIGAHIYYLVQKQVKE